MEKWHTVFKLVEDEDNNITLEKVRSCMQSEQAVNCIETESEIEEVYLRSLFGHEPHVMISSDQENDINYSPKTFLEITP